MKRELPNQRLKRLRMAKEYSLQGLADEVRMSKAHLWEMEQSVITIRRACYHNLETIALALGTTVAKLMA